MKEPKLIAQRIIRNGRDQEGTGLESWIESASYLIDGYAESKTLDALNQVIRHLQRKINSHNESPITASDQHRLGKLNGLNEALEISKEIRNKTASNETKQQAMKIKATAYDTQDGEPREMDHIRWIGLDENGRPQRICAPNGIQYRKFELKIEQNDD